jgi:hypothetical protein
MPLMGEINLLILDKPESFTAGSPGRVLLQLGTHHAGEVASSIYRGQLNLVALGSRALLQLGTHKAGGMVSSLKRGITNLLANRKR